MDINVDLSTENDLDVPTEWEHIPFTELTGTLLIVGAPDTGKSTFARYLYRRLCRTGSHRQIAFIDGDIGQASLGPPTTMTLALGKPGDDRFPPSDYVYRAFVGAVSPRRHMLPTVVAAHRLVWKAYMEGATTVVFDTTGLINPAHGGGELKRAKIELLRPTAILALQRDSELEHILFPLRRSRRFRVTDLPVSQAVRKRGILTRQMYRAERFRRYFQHAQPITVEWRRLAVFPAPAFSPHRLVALEDGAGLALGLAVVVENDPLMGVVTLYTPLGVLDRREYMPDVDAIRVSDLTLDPGTYRATV